MKISIVTPSYNQGIYLEKTIASIWNQKGDFELEHIVIDGGSTDQSISIIKKYDQLCQRGQFPFQCKSFKFIWFSERDEGQSDALNKGFSLSSGDILAWLNSDDIYCSNDSLKIVLEAFLKNEADIVMGNLYVIDEKGRLIDLPLIANGLNNDEFQKILPDIRKIDFIMQPACFFKRRLWETLGISKDCYIMDWVLWIEAYKNHYHFFKINDYIASYRLQDNAKTVFASKDKVSNIKRCEEIIAMYNRYGTWCLNRFYYSFYLLLLRVLRYPSIGSFIDLLIHASRKARNIIALRHKLY